MLRRFELCKPNTGWHACLNHDSTAEKFVLPAFCSYMENADMQVPPAPAAVAAVGTSAPVCFVTQDVPSEPAEAARHGSTPADLAALQQRLV